MAVFLTLPWIGILLLGARGVGQRELACEETAVHLEDCCPAFDPIEIDCAFTSGCGDPGDEPFFTLEAASCLRALSCDELVASGSCDRLQLVVDAQADDDLTVAVLGAEVCP